MAWAPAYATVDELRSFIADGSTGSDTELALAIEAASRSVDRICNRQFGMTDAPQTRTYAAQYDHITSAFGPARCWGGPHRRWVIEIDDLMTVDGLVVQTNDGATITDYLPAPVNAVLGGRPWTKLLLGQGVSIPPGAQVVVTGTFGWSAVPDTIKLATLIQASRLFARRHAPFGIAGDPQVGQMRLLERLDVDLATSVQPYVRTWGAV